MGPQNNVIEIKLIKLKRREYLKVVINDLRKKWSIVILHLYH